MGESNYRYQIDRKAARFLNAVSYFGGKATLTEIRQRTGLSRDETNHRFDRLADLELIDVSYAEHGYGDREPPKVAELTGIARKEIERGLLAPVQDEDEGDNGPTDLEAEIRALREQVDRQERRLDTLSASTPQIEEVDDQLEELDEVLLEVEEFTYEWMETAEAYLLALREVVEQEHNVSMESRIEAAKPEDMDER